MPEDIEALSESLKELITKYYFDPVTFVRDVFGADPTEQQVDVLQSIQRDRKVSVRAGHGVGKSTLASWAVYWFLLTRPYSKIICTAPTFHQLYDILWAEAASWRQKSTLITDLFDWKQRRIEAKWSPENWWAAARTADKGESLTGRHAGHFMLIVDEASGVDDGIFEASEGMLTSENSYVLLLGNPTKNSGYFFNSHNRDKALWKTHKLSCKDSRLVAERYITDTRARYGEDSNFFRVRVLGEFPITEVDALIPYMWVSDAVDREITVRDEPLFLGVDVGAGGDKSVILHRRGAKIEKICTHDTKNTMELLGWVGQEAMENKAAAIFVDTIGVGKGVYDRLSELNFRVYPVDVRSRARRQGFKRLRDELWWTTREQFERGTISIPNNEDFVGELTSIKYKPESDGTIKIESKLDMRRRGLASPDISDALCLTFYLGDELFNETGLVDEEDELYRPEIKRNRFTGY